VIVDIRPFNSVDDLNAKLGQGKKKAGPAGISPRIFEDTIGIFEGYKAVDIILEDCEEIASTLRATISRWTIPSSESSKSENTNSILKESEEGMLDLVSVVPSEVLKSRGYLETQPSLLDEDVQLKGYQLLGVNWLHLLYRRRLSCILADEMGKC
jgi:SWI/SNF-related matrix-associated actin-dependent regulator 1 of chromatin subfamily A